MILGGASTGRGSNGAAPKAGFQMRGSGLVPGDFRRGAARAIQAQGCQLVLERLQGHMMSAGGGGGVATEHYSRYWTAGEIPSAIHAIHTGLLVKSHQLSMLVNEMRGCVFQLRTRTGSTTRGGDAACNQHMDS